MTLLNSYLSCTYVHNLTKNKMYNKTLTDIYWWADIYKSILFYIQRHTINGYEDMVKISDETKIGTFLIFFH